MSQNLKITEGGGERNFTGVKRLKTDKTDGGACFWVPEDERRLETLHASRNGDYLPNTGYYAFDEVDARSISGIKAGDHDYTVYLDDLGNPHINTGGLDVSIDEAGNPIATYNGEPVDIDDIWQYIDMATDLSIDLDSFDISGLDLSGLDVGLNISLDGLDIDAFDLPDEIRIIREPIYEDGKPVSISDFTVQAYRGGQIWEDEDGKYLNGIIPQNELRLTVSEERGNKFNVLESVLWRKEEYTFDGGEGTIGVDYYTKVSQIPFVTGSEATFKSMYRKRYTDIYQGAPYRVNDVKYDSNVKINVSDGAKIVLLKYKTTVQVDKQRTATVYRVRPFVCDIDGRENADVEVKLTGEYAFEKLRETVLAKEYSTQPSTLPYWYRGPRSNISYTEYKIGTWHDWYFYVDNFSNHYLNINLDFYNGKYSFPTFINGVQDMEYYYEWGTQEGNLPFFDIDEILNFPTAEDEERHHNKPNYTDLIHRIAVALFYTDDGELRNDDEFEPYHPAMVTIEWDRPRDNITLTITKEAYVKENETSAQLDAAAAHPGTTVNEAGFSHHSGRF